MPRSIHEGRYRARATATPLAVAMRRALADERLAKAETLARQPDPVVETPGEAKHRVKAERRAAMAAAEKDRQTRQSRAKAGLSHDARTAGSRRELSMREIDGRPRADLADYGKLFRNPGERTDARVRACRLFDDLCHRAYAGLYPEPRFEPLVDASAPRPGLPDNRIDGLREMQRLAQRIGDEAHALLVHRVFLRMQFTAMAADGQGDERALAVLFLSAADAVARFYQLLPPSRGVQAMNERLDGGDLPNRAV